MSEEKKGMSLGCIIAAVIGVIIAVIGGIILLGIIAAIAIPAFVNMKDRSGTNFIDTKPLVAVSVYKDELSRKSGVINVTTQKR